MNTTPATEAGTLLLAELLHAALEDAHSPIARVRLGALRWAQASLPGAPVTPGSGGVPFAACCAAFNLDPQAVYEKLQAAPVTLSRRPGWLTELVGEAQGDLFRAHA